MPVPQSYIAGLDLGQAADYSALSILQHAGPGERPWQPEQRFHLRHLERWPLGTSYPAIVTDVVGMLSTLARQGDVTLALDATGCGRPVLDLFRAALPKSPGAGWAGQDMPVTPRVRLIAISITGGDRVTSDSGTYNVPKRDLASAVQVALQTRRLTIAEGLPDTAVLVAELQNFRVKISLAGHDSYAAGSGEPWREGSHDDLVLSVACALWAAQRTRGARLQAV